MYWNVPNFWPTAGLSVPTFIPSKCTNTLSAVNSFKQYTGGRIRPRLFRKLQNGLLIFTNLSLHYHQFTKSLLLVFFKAFGSPTFSLREAVDKDTNFDLGCAVSMWNATTVVGSPGSISFPTVSSGAALPLL
mmetsp:Transcript_18424/g.37690  ORF Transcript_18424/g.37690 Transcript_18424/m.37690 type:complete len:132 (+) Transcript_18424:2381-2776(+)